MRAHCRRRSALFGSLATSSEKIWSAFGKFASAPTLSPVLASATATFGNPRLRSAIRYVVRISRDQRFIDGECLLEFLQGASVISQFQQGRARITKLNGEFASPKRVCGIEIDER